MEAIETASSRILTTDGRVDRCPNKLNHIDGTFGEIEIYLAAQDVEAVVPCGACRTEDYNEAKAKLMSVGN